MRMDNVAMGHYYIIYYIILYILIAVATHTLFLLFSNIIFDDTKKKNGNKTSKNHVQF